MARTAPIHRVEFSVMHAITQREHPAMVPFEIEKVRPPRSNNWTERKRAWFPFYVFVGLRDYDEFRRLRAAINKAEEDIGKRPPIIGLIGFGGRLAKLTAAEVEFLRATSVEGPRSAEIYKPVQPGDAVTFALGSRFEGRTGTVDSATRDRIKVMTEVFGRMVVVEEDRGKVTVAA